MYKKMVFGPKYRSRRSRNRGGNRGGNRGRNRRGGIGK
jgi:hypothetical protein